MSLMNTQYDSIMRMYAARQARSRQEYEERMEQIQKDVPELAPWTPILRPVSRPGALCGGGESCQTRRS